jgi:hypothetical protein
MEILHARPASKDMCTDLGLCEPKDVDRSDTAPPTGRSALFRTVRPHDAMSTKSVSFGAAPSDVGYMLHISDVHYDPLYAESGRPGRQLTVSCPDINQARRWTARRRCAARPSMDLAMLALLVRALLVTRL